MQVQRQNHLNITWNSFGRIWQKNYPPAEKTHFVTKQESSQRRQHGKKIIEKIPDNKIVFPCIK